VQTAVAFDFKGGLFVVEYKLAETQTLDLSELAEIEDVGGLEAAAAFVESKKGANGANLHEIDDSPSAVDSNVRHDGRHPRIDEFD
jgi:hypothetical protein